jgi:uncharacterized protein
MRIAIDIDSTLHHYWDVLSDAAQRRFGVQLPYELQSTWGITRLRPDQLEVCIAESHREDVILAGRPYPDAVEIVNRWHDAGHVIHVMSHRDPAAHDATARWLDRIGLRYDELHCSANKVSRCVDLGIEILIDDCPDHILRALAAGIVPATIAHPWNRDVCEEEGILCAPDWPALARLLTPALGAGVAALR